MAFHPDGAHLVSASYDQTVGFWEVATGRLLVDLPGHEGWVMSAAFSPDGALVASASMDKTIRLWNSDLDSWPVRACRIANRNLKKEGEWDQYLGEDVPYRLTCPDLPEG